MPVPDRIRILRDAHRTETIGRYSGGLFFAWISWCHRSGEQPNPRYSGWEERKRISVALHRFDRRGEHTGSDIWFGGTWAEMLQRGHDVVLAPARARLAEQLDGLPGRVYADIAIRPFHLEVDGVSFGLVTGQGDGREWAEFLPMGIVFNAPWDGLYDT